MDASRSLGRSGFGREKDRMKSKVDRSVAKKNLPKSIISDETIVLTGDRTCNEYPERLRRVTAHVHIEGRWCDMEGDAFDQVR